MTTAPASSFRLLAALVLASTLVWACASRSAFKPCNVTTPDKPQVEPGAADTTDGDPAADSTG